MAVKDFVKTLSKKYKFINDYVDNYGVDGMIKIIEDNSIENNNIKNELEDVIYQLVIDKIPMYYDDIQKEFMNQDLSNYAYEVFLQNIFLAGNSGKAVSDGRIPKKMQKMLYYHYIEKYRDEINDIIRDIKKYKKEN